MRHVMEAVEVRRLFATVTGRVFHDLNADGSASSGENGLGGAKVYVDLNKDGKRQSNEPQATSGSSGAYTLSSSSIAKGKTYTVRLTPPSGYIGTASKSVFLSTNSTKAPDLGTWKYAKVTIKAFLDVNRNYKLDKGEPDLAGVKYWEDINNNIRQDAADPVYGPGTVTLNLKPGFHRVSPVGFLSGYQFVTTTAGNFTVTSGQVTTGAAFGYYYPAKFGGYVYQDKNKNGKYDSGEGVAGRRVFADRDNDNHQDEGEYSGKTDATGYYVIGLNPGTYTLRQVLPSGWTGGTKKITVAGSSYATVNGNDLVTAPSTTATHGTVSGYVFNDLNANGKQEAGEGNWTQAAGGSRGLPNVYIDIDKDGHLDNDERVQKISADGSFTFTDVLPGTHRFVAYGFGSTAITTKPVTVTVSAGQTSAINFGAQAYTQIDIQRFLDADGNGRLSGMELSDVVPAIIYVDANDNGKFDAGELRDEPHSNQSWLTTMKVPHGTHKIRVVAPNGLSITGYGGYNLAPGSTFASDKTLRLPADDLFNDGEMMLYFGFGGTPAVTGTVFEDRNGNGQYDTSEWGTDQYSDFVYADANGNRKYDNGEDEGAVNYDGTFKLYPKPGKYTICTQLWGGIQQTVAVNTAVTVAPGVTPPPVTFGLRLWRDDRIPNFNVTGRVFNDKNKNGLFEAGESGNAYAGWRVYFDIDGTGDFNDNNAYASAVVAADGTYSVPINADGTPFRLLLQNKTGLKYSTSSSYTVSSTTGGATLTGRNFGLYSA